MKRQIRSLFSGKNMLIYFFVVIIPVLASSYQYYSVITGKIEGRLSDKVMKEAVQNSLYIENFMVETVGRIETLALTISAKDNPAWIQEMLSKMHQLDPRFSGFIWASDTGQIRLSSIPFDGKLNLSDRSYFTEAIRTGRSQIFGSLFRTNKRKLHCIGGYACYRFRGTNYRGIDRKRQSSGHERVC
ncbi:hypothetical protein [Paenibacillus residui]|uniref:Uncharacterized protein n=1 Tax=Paenibacillus residui TaxID=629724 RepID=A0ABW3D9F3_9BACL